jgi:hypothetical protein
MSTKTIYKRIALVAVAALGAGVLSVAPANAGNNAAAGGSNVNTAAGVLNIAVAPSVTGAAVLAASGAASGTLSAGLLANSTTQNTDSLTSTATLTSTGEAAFYYTAATTGAAVTIVVDGGSVTAATQAAGVANYNSSKTKAVYGPDSAAALILAFSVKPTAGATTTTVSLYETAAAAASNGNAAALVNIQSGAVSSGSLKQRYTITVAATSQSGTYSAANSAVRAVLSGSAGQAESSNVDETGATSIVNALSSVAFININLKDPYKVTLDGVGAMTIDATNGVGLSYKDDGTVATSGFNLVAVATDTSGTLTVARPAAAANKPLSTTVTVKWNGAVVGTKTINFQGEIATVKASAPLIGALSATNTSAFEVDYADAAGNAIYPSSGTAAVSSSLAVDGSVSGLSIGTYTADDSALGSLTCGATPGAKAVKIQHVNPFSGTTVTSNEWTATCAGNADTYTASWDKASYTPGSIATLTITFKDIKGNLANAYDLIGNGSLVTVTGGPSATAVVIPAATDKPSSGAGTKTYQFVVGGTLGDFSAVVSVPDVNGVNGVNQTASYKVATATTGVTNEDVLKAIVSLIASINKQIALLQKALLKK